MTTALTQAQSPLSSALQDKLKALLDKPITVALLYELEKTAILARKLLELQDPKSKLTRRVGAYGGGAIIGGNFETDDYDPEVGAVGVPVYPALASAPGSETFGAAVIRELIPALKRQGQPRLSIADLTDAANIARKTKNEKLLAKIEAKIESVLAEQFDDDGSEPGDLSGIGEVKMCPRPGCASPAAVTDSGTTLPTCIAHYDGAAIAAEGDAS